MAYFSSRLAILTGCAALALTSAAHADSYDAAAAALAKGDPRSARIELLNAIKADPGNSRAHLLQGRVYLELGDGVAAEAEIRRARETGTPADQTHHLLAHALLLQNKPAEAIDEAADVPPRFVPYAARMRGRAQAVLGKHAEAAAEFDRAVALTPNDAELWSDIGRLRLARRDFAGARTAADRAATLAPRDLDALVLQGDLAREVKDVPKALAWYGRALAADPDNIPAMLGKAGALSEAGRMRDMLAATREVLRRDGKNAYAFHLQARLAAMAGNFTLARSLLKRTGDTLDAYPAAMLLAGVVEFRTGNDEQAIERLSRLVALQPGNAKARRILGAAQWRAGSADAALATLQPLVGGRDPDRFALLLTAKALEKKGDAAGARALRTMAAQPSPRKLIEDVVYAERAMGGAQWGEAIRRYESLRAQTGGKDAAVLNNLAWAYANGGKPERALPLAESAYKLAPDNASVIDSYGWFLHVAGSDPKRALTLLEEAAAKAPGNPAIRWHLAQAYAAQGRKPEARRAIEAALAVAGFAERDKARALLATL